MNLNLFSLSSIINLSLALVIGIFVYLKSPHKRTRTLWIIFCFAVSIWSFASLRFSTILSKEKSMFWWQIANIGVILSPVFFFHLITHILSLTKKKEVIVWYLFASFFIIVNIFYKRIFIGDLHLIYNQFYWISWGLNNLLHIVFFISFWTILLPYCFILMVLKYRRVSGSERMRIKYFMLGALISWLGGYGNFMPCISPKVYPLSNFLVGVYSFILGYAMVRYHLMDIKVALTRGMALLITYLFVFGLPLLLVFLKPQLVNLFGNFWWIMPLGLFSALALLGPFAAIFLINRIEQKRLQKEEDLAQARFLIDTLGMLKEKTKGNLTEEETNLLENVLYEL
ncbi:MAG: DUF1844 domain-containing protein, partial [Candidatus Omnitrophica bacterium]|nr:DUF1844 domain-containing protein [Candidatus Omnitrophota bacterium]